MNGNKRRINKEGFVLLQDARFLNQAINKIENDNMIKGSLYHYTSTKVLDAILSSGTFRASNIFYLNDKIEYKMGVDILHEIFQGDKLILEYLREIENLDGRSWGGVYTISFSKEPDVLQQWITYAKEGGVCIELDGDIIWNSKVNKLYLGLGNNFDGHIRNNEICFLQLIYSRKNSDSASALKKQAEDIKKYFAEAICEKNGDKYKDSDIENIWEKNREYARSFLQLLAVYFKEERFKGEDEIRAAFLPISLSPSNHTKIFYLAQDNGVLRPYINVTFLQTDIKSDEKFKAGCPIKSILVGPGGNQDNVFDSIVHRLRDGEVKCWRYSKKKLENFLGEYILGCFKAYPNEVSGDDCEAIANILARDWCETSGYFHNIETAEKDKVKITLTKQENLSPENTDTDYAGKAKDIAEKYWKDNILSEQGIWVKKSTISYIF